MIIHAKRLIFVHIQKTGGNAIAAALGQDPNCPEKHFLARDLLALYGAEVWDSYFKFAFVRNPWDRLVSWWSMIDAHRADAERTKRLNPFQRFILERARTFPEFLENCDVEIVDADGPKFIFRNQLDYLTDESGQLLVDFVGRFETLQQNFDRVTEKALGATLPLPHVNRSRHSHYREYFTPQLADKVARRFAPDIEAFGYAFGQ